jgi:hypothetical protein
MKTSESILQTYPILTKNIVDKTKTLKAMDECSRIMCVRFGRWLLKYATGRDVGNGLCYSYENQEYNTDELYELFYQQTEHTGALAGN